MTLYDFYLSWASEFRLGTAPPPLSNSWTIVIIWLYIALNRTPNIEGYGGGGGSTQSLGFLAPYASLTGCHSGIMEKKTETTKVHWVFLWRIMENKMETTKVYWGLYWG